MNRETLRLKIAEMRAEGCRNSNVQGIVVGATGAILARLLAFISHTFGLTPYFTAILFETVFPAVLVFIQQKMSGHSIVRSMKAAAIASVVGFGATAATGIVST